LTVRRWIGLGLAALSAALIALALPGAAAPQVPGLLTVDTTADGNDGECTRDCTLREAVAIADTASGSSVRMLPGVYRLTQPLVVGNDTIFGANFAGNFSAGARTTVIDARGSGRVVQATPGTNAFLAGVTLTGGQADTGAGLLVPDTANVSLFAVEVSENTATGRGGGIAAAGDVAVFRSLVTQNRAADGGGIAVDPSGLAQLFASTVSGNTATASGGGISSTDETTLWNATVANNRAPVGAGIYWTGAAATTTMWNTIVAGNTTGACGGAISQRNQWQANIVDDATCALAAGEGVQQTDPRIGPLANNRGPTNTHALAAASPAINAGGASLCGSQTDQRGALPVGGNCDIGAFEFGGDVPESDLPPPTPGETVNVSLRSGTVKVKLPGSDEFFTLKDGQQVPVGTTMDTTKGQITMVAAGRKQKAWFYDGLFKFGQTRGRKPLTTLSLTAKLACPKGNGAIAAAKKKRRLWGDGKGRFRTKGSFSSATVRGTKWLTEDRCNGTLTRVTKGTVTVRDFKRKRNVIVRAGQRYLAQR
jgi:CSLREA domain-containing protein